MMKPLFILIGIILIATAAVILFSNSDTSFPYCFVAVILVILGFASWRFAFRFGKGGGRLPNYLSQNFAGCFERDGFCFIPHPVAIDGIAYLDVWYQNNYEGECFAQIVLLPSVGFWLGREEWPKPFDFQIECKPCEFGCYRIPWAIPEGYQGKTLKLDVAASSDYPMGKGLKMRYCNSVPVSSYDSLKKEGGRVDPKTTAFAIAGVLMTKSEALTEFTLPSNVKTSLIQNYEARKHTFWKMGDPVVPMIPAYGNE